MSRTITQRELRNDTGAVLRAVQSGETFTVTRHGNPVAELRPIERSRLVPREVIARGNRIAPRIDATQFRAGLDALIARISMTEAARGLLDT
jgi:prevent-host-death family protein